MKKFLLPLILILYLVFTLTGFCWVAGYDQRVKLTIDETKIDTADLENFPVTAFFTDAQAEEIFVEFDADEDFDRGQFALGDDTLLKAEKELFDDSESLGLYHIKIPLVYYDEDTDYYFYYDNDAGHNTDYIGIAGSATAAEVWVDYKAVYHMNDNTVDVDIALELPEHSGTGDPAIALGIFTAVNCSELTKVNGTLKIDLKVADPNLIEGEIQQLEISSSISNDTNEWYFDTSALDITTDYQTFEIPLSTWSTAGGEVDVSAIVRIRLYAFTSGNPVTIYWKNAYIVYPAPIIDSTSNVNHGTKKGVGEPVEAAGQVGLAQYFDKVDDRIDLASDIIIGANCTIEGIIYLDVNNIWQAVFADCGGADDYGYVLFVTTTGELRFFGSTNGEAGNATNRYSTNASLATETYYHISAVKNNTSLTFYKDGSPLTDDSGTIHSSYFSSSKPTQIGIYNNVTCPFDGKIDEFRYSDINRSAAWIKATYTSLWDTLLTYGSEETPAGIVWNGVTITKWNGITITKINGK